MKLTHFSLAIIVCLVMLDSVLGISSINVMSNISSNTTVPALVTEAEEHIAVKKWKKTEKIGKEIAAAVVKSVLPYLLRVSEGLDVPSKCTRSVMKTLTGLKKMELWAYKLLDASGKLPNGFINGNINALGDYDECISIEVSKNFRGQYCFIELAPPLPERRPFVHTDAEVTEFINFTTPGTFFEEFARRAMHYYRINFRTSICVPSTCSKEDVHKIASRAVELSGIEFDVLVPSCEIKEEKISFSTSEITIMVIMCILVFLGVSATAVDVILKLSSGSDAYQETLSIPLRCLMCFSFYTNTVKLLKSDKSPDSIKVFHGMKVITILWVILNHTYYYLNFQASSGLLYATTLGKDISFQFIANGFLNVETFFFISAVLIAYGVMKMKEKKLNIFLYIFRRIWRLTPPFMFVIALVFLVKHINRGPVWKETVVDTLVDKCQKNWWTNLIYINNFIPSQDMCLQWLWYIPVDTHLYLVSLVFLIPLKSNVRLAFIMNGLFFVTGIIISAASNIYYGLHPTAIYVFNHPKDINYYIERGYFRTYLHCSTYCVGLTVGYILATRQKLKIPLAANIIGWLTAFVLALSVLYGVFEWNQGNVPGLFISTLYTCTNKFVWALALAWVTVCCMTGNGGIATTILSWQAFVPLGRLTYMAYLIHPIIHYINLGSTRTLIPLEHRYMLYLYLGNVVLAFICAYVLSLLFESPFMALEKVMFMQKTPRKNTSENTVVEVPDTVNQYEKPRISENGGVYGIKIKQVENNG